MRCFPSLIFFLLLQLPLQAQHLFNSPIFATDLENFRSAFDAFEKDTTQNPFVHYLAVGSPALTDINQQMIGGAAKLRQHVMGRMDFYREVRKRADTWVDYRDRVNYVSQQMIARVPEAQLPYVYLVIGKENSGGTIGSNGVIVGLETFCYSDSLPDPFHIGRTMENLPEVVASLIVHYNLTGYGDHDLLQQCIAAGVAEYFTEELTRDLKIKNPQWKYHRPYGDAHACEVWNSFLPDRHTKDFGKWFWNYGKENPNPGYWIGYTIVNEYVKENKNKPGLMGDLLNLQNLIKFAEEKMVSGFCH